MTETELLNLMREWKNEMKGVVADYSTLAAKLDAAVTVVEDSKKKWWVVYKTPITIAATVVILVIGVWVSSNIMSRSNVCEVNVNADGNGFTLKSCADKKDKK